MYQLEGLQKEIFEKKYRAGDTETIQGMWHRVAKAVASVEADTQEWRTKEFETLLSDFKFIPGGRVSAGAGTKNNYLLNCATLPIEDSIDGIYETVKKAAVMAKCQYGTGFDFSTIRPKNDAVTKGGTASGPVSFMKVFDASGAIIETGGCFAEGTLINTNRGLVPVEQVVADSTIEYAVTHKGLRRITARFDNGIQPVLTVTTNNGYSVTTTPTHKFKQFNAEGGFDDVLAKDLKPGDRVPLLASSVEVGTATKLQTRFEYIELPGCTTLNRDVVLPTEMCEDFAYFIGFMLGNGYIDADKRIQLSVSNTYPDVVTQLCRISETLFGLTPIVTPGDGKCTVVCVYSAYLVEYLRVNGLGKAKAAEIKVPEMFFTETPANISAFVAGYFDADGHQPVTKAQRTFASVSKPLLGGIQQLLLQLGVFCTVAVNRHARNAWKTLYRLSVPNNGIGARFYLATSKYSKKVVNLNPRGCSKQFVYTRFTPKSLGAVDKEFRGLATGNHNISHSTLCKLAERSQVVKDLSLEYVVEDTIVSVVPAGNAHVYDIEVEDLHLVSGNGFYTSNSRRAAAIGVLRVDHPDIFEFIEAKREQGVLTNFNISVGITQPFLDAVKADQNFDLVFNGKVYRTVKAKEIWDKLVSSAYNFNDPGLLMIDEVNKYNNGYYLYEIGTTNPCFTGDMRLLTEDGYKSFKELDGTQFKVQAVDGTFTDSKVWCSGVKDVVEVSFHNPEFTPITCTPDHIFKLAGGSQCEANNLKGMQVQPYYKLKTSFERIPFMAGFIQGDGCTSRILSGDHKGIEVNIGAKDLDVAKLFNAQVNGRHWYSEEAREVALKYKLSTEYLPERDFPDYNWKSKEELLDFLSGLWSANGSVITKYRVALKTTNKRLALVLQDILLTELGIKAYITTNKTKDVTFSNGTYTCKESYDLNIGRYRDIIVFAESISFAQEYRRTALVDLLAFKAPKVKKVVTKGQAPVFDFTEPKHHWGVVEGVTVHNCGEIPLPPYGVCDLGNLNLTKYVLEPFAHHSGLLTNFNTDAYKYDIRTAVRFLDNILDVSEYPYEEIAKRAQGDRRIGLNGVAGFGSFLAMLRIPYDSPDAVETATTLQYWCMCEAYQASIELAKEKGPFPNFDAEQYLKAEFVQKLPDHIKEGIKQYGIRNLALLTIPPVGTGSLLAGNISNGLEPIFALEYNRKVRQPDQSLKEEAVEDYAWKLYKQTPEYLTSRAGEAPPVFFQTSRDIVPAAHINVQAAFQEYIDGSISKTVNMPEATTLKEYEDVLWYAIGKGCKGFTSFREGTREGVLSTKEEKKEKPTHIVTEEPIKAKEPKKKRARILAGKTYKITDDKGNLYITINDITEKGKTRPFEIFINSNGENSEYSQWYKAIGKLMSAVMRRTDDCSFLIKDLQGIFGSNGYFSDGRFVQSQPQMVGNILEEHIRSLHPEEAKEVKYTKCPECGEQTYYKEGGCGKCLSCGYSSCG